MNNLRIREKNIIHTEIKKLNGFIVHAERTILSTISNYDTNKLREGIIEKEQKISLLNERLKDVESGNLDEELEKITQDNLEEIERKDTATKSRKGHLAEQKKIREDKAKENIDGINASGREERYAEKNYNSTLRFFDKMCDLIPDYLLKDLVGKPNNRGFIWKGVHLYGLKPPIGDPTEYELVERISRDMMNIHIWNENFYEVYSKKYGERPVKVSGYKRPKNFKIPTGITFSHN